MNKTDAEILQQFGANLKKVRMAKGYSLRELYALCGIDNSTISKMEKGEINITILTIVKLAQALEVDINNLISSRILNV
ncbi:helix-turn-helix transcriptional regulator [uncultured Chitinophaga sp.]|jgi:Predicted transcriptional regulator|uniref:helix-turn-helix domain-containing protein n=1 Tax=uncultured Chitinophaga sp. TaxID=339340 RepID=UPI00261BA65F|nr:helix-turn-helix transcriptional regulator [uncultured Chitinophaga sp.]